MAMADEAEKAFENTAEWLRAAQVLAKTLREFVQLQAKHKDELRSFAEIANARLEQVQPASTTCHGSGLFLSRVSALFAQVSSAQDEMCVNLPLDIDELEKELEIHATRLTTMQKEARERNLTFQKMKMQYRTSLETFMASFNMASKALEQGMNKDGIDPNIFEILDSDDKAEIKTGRETKAVEQIAMQIRASKNAKNACVAQYKSFRKIASEYIRSLESIHLNQQQLECDCTQTITSIVQKFIVGYMSLIKNMEYDTVQLNQQIEEESQRTSEEEPLVHLISKEIQAEMQAMAPPISAPLELPYFLEQYFPTTSLFDTKDDNIVQIYDGVLPFQNDRKLAIANLMPLGMTRQKKIDRMKDAVWGSSILASLFCMRSVYHLSRISVDLNLPLNAEIITSDFEFVLVYDGNFTAEIHGIGLVEFRVSLHRRRDHSRTVYEDQQSLTQFFLENNTTKEYYPEEVLICHMKESYIDQKNIYVVRMLIPKGSANDFVAKSFLATNIVATSRVKLMGLHIGATNSMRFIGWTSSRKIATRGRSIQDDRIALRDDCSQVMKASPFFADIPAKDLMQLADLGTISIIEPNKRLMEENEVGGCEMSILLTGSVAVYQHNSEQMISKKVAMLESGACIGEMSFLIHMPRTATLVTATECMLMSIDGTLFLKFLKSYPQVHEKLRCMLNERLVQNAVLQHTVPFFQAIPYNKLMEWARLCFIEDNVPEKVIVLPVVGRPKFSILISGSVEHTAAHTGKSKISTSGYYGTFSRLRLLTPGPWEAFDRIFDSAELAAIHIRLYQYNCDVIPILDNPISYESYLRFVSSEFSQENLLFVLAVQNYRAFPSIDSAVRLYHEFVAATAIQQVNLEAKLRHEILNTIESRTFIPGEKSPRLVAIFERAYDEIIRLMRKDSFPRFKKSKYFSEILTNFQIFQHTVNSPLQDNAVKEQEDIHRRFNNSLSKVNEREAKRKQAKYAFFGAKSPGMGVICSSLSYGQKQDVWGSSLLSPLFVEEDLDSLGGYSVFHSIHPGFPIISPRCKIALLYEGKITALIPQLGSVSFNVSSTHKYSGVHKFGKGNLAVSRFFQHRHQMSNASNQFTIDTEEMLISMNTNASNEYLLRLCITKTDANEVVIKSYRATSIQVLDRCKLLALEKPSASLAYNAPGVYYLMNNVLNSDSLTLLRSVSFFNDIADEKLLRLADLSTISLLAPECVVFRENDEEGSEMFITLAGTLEVSSIQNGTSIVLAKLRAGSCFGEMALLTRVPRAATIKVLENAMLLSIERNSFLEFLDENPEVRSKLKSLLQERFMKKALSSNIVPFFQAIDFQHLIDLSHNFIVEDTIQSGDIILTPETYGSKFCIIICGSVDAINCVGDSKMTTELHPGSYFGTFGSLLHSTSVAHTVVAKSSCVLFTCPIEISSKVIGSSPIAYAEIYIRWLRENCELKHVMVHPTAHTFLTTFCKSEFSEENALFLMDIDTYTKMSSPVDRRKMACYLYETYISETAPKQVNIDHQMRENVLQQLKLICASDIMNESEEMEIELTMFEPAKNEITRLMVKDSFPRFKRSPYFAQMLEAFAPYSHARHISLADAVTQFKEKIVLSPRENDNQDKHAMGQAAGGPMPIAAATASNCIEKHKEIENDMSLSNAILFARKFTQRHPLFVWREDETLLRNMGIRPFKYAFLVDFHDLTGTANSCVLLSLMPTQESLLCHQSMSLTTYKLKALLVALKHPNLLPILDVHHAIEPYASSECMQRPGILIAQPFIPSGSLKDLLYEKANPRGSYTTKYALRRASSGLPRLQVSRYARQVLHGLAALRSKGIICEHLKTSNIIIDNGVARISDIFNTLLCLDRDTTLRNYTLPLESSVDVDFLLFGHCLYEMACGQELGAVAPTEKDLNEFHPEIAQVLQIIFVRDTPEEITIDLLLDLPLFASNDSLPPHPIRLDGQMKSIIKTSMRINQTRRQAHRIQYEEEQTVEEARRIAETSHEDKLKGHHQRFRAKKSSKRSRFRASCVNYSQSKSLSSEYECYDYEYYGRWHNIINGLLPCTQLDSVHNQSRMKLHKAIELLHKRTSNVLILSLVRSFSWMLLYVILARQLHPDVTGNDIEKASLFKRVNEANAVLSDPIKREEYDNRYSYHRPETEYSPRGQTNQRASTSTSGRHYGINEDVWYANHYGIHAARSGRWTGRINMNYGSHIPEQMYEAQMESIRRQEATQRIQNGYMLRRELRLKKQAEEAEKERQANKQTQTKEESECTIS
ncbi:hypothetical protein THRCLA_08021 [Thraustotheca clavata]|uniref:Uncharacterized protein n=1 Tax=Thraustotheca clavata TaxID=74557 RepID=A0A1V9ZB59_9STRA|nr:hypothetical protein THRCLA_08021 [Thraustotheca clavata]